MSEPELLETADDLVAILDAAAAVLEHAAVQNLGYRSVVNVHRLAAERARALLSGESVPMRRMAATGTLAAIHAVIAAPPPRPEAQAGSQGAFVSFAEHEPALITYEDDVDEATVHDAGSGVDIEESTDDEATALYNLSDSQAQFLVSFEEVDDTGTVGGDVELGDSEELGGFEELGAGEELVDTAAFGGAQAAHLVEDLSDVGDDLGGVDVDEGQEGDFEQEEDEDLASIATVVFGDAELALVEDADATEDSVQVAIRELTAIGDLDAVEDFVEDAVDDDKTVTEVEVTADAATVHGDDAADEALVTPVPIAEDTGDQPSVIGSDQEETLVADLEQLFKFTDLLASDVDEPSEEGDIEALELTVAPMDDAGIEELPAEALAAVEDLLPDALEELTDDHESAGDDASSQEVLLSAVVDDEDTLVPKSQAAVFQPRAAAIQLGPTGESKVLGLDEEEEPLEMMAAEDFEDDEGVGDGFTVEEVDAFAEDDADVEEDAMEDPETAATMALMSAAAALPSDDQLSRLLAEAQRLEAEGAIEPAIERYSDVLDARPDQLSAHLGRGRLYLDLGDYARAMSDFTVAEEQAPEDPEPHVAVGDLYFARKDYRKAIDRYDAALGLAPKHAMAMCRRGISHYYRKNYEDAVKDITEAQRLDPDIPNINTYVQMAKRKAKKR